MRFTTNKIYEMGGAKAEAAVRIPNSRGQEKNTLK